MSKITLPDGKTQSTTFDSQSPKYPERGYGMQDWIDDGRPDYDVKGRELDPAAWPTGNMLDPDNAPPAPPSPPASTNLVGGEAWVVLDTPDSVVEVPFTTEAVGSYWLEASEQPDQNWTLSLGGEVVATSNGSSDEAAPFQMKAAGHGVLSCSFNAAAVSPEQLAERIAAGQGVSKMHYTLRAVA